MADAGSENASGHRAAVAPGRINERPRYRSNDAAQGPTRSGTYRPLQAHRRTPDTYRRQPGDSDERDYGFVDGQLELQPLDDVDDWRRGKLVSPDPTSVWPQIEPIRQTWMGTDDRTLVVGGLHGFETVLHSLDVDESDEEVGLLARIGFTREAARRRVEASEQLGEATVGIGWSAEVRLQNPLAGRRIIDRGVLQLEILHSQERTPLHARVIAHLEGELAAAPSPAERRRIRQMIKAIRRNPDKAIPWIEDREADEERRN